MENKQNKLRKNITVTPDIWDYIEKQSYVFGMSASSYIAMVVTNYRQQTAAMSTMLDLKEMVDKMEKLSLSKEK